MINGWFCRGVSGEQGDQDYSNMVAKSETSEEDAMPMPERLMDHRARYKNLKKRLKFLIYENEFLTDTLRTSQHNFLKVSKDRCFLLDRLLKYETPSFSSSESNDDSDSSDDEVAAKKKKTETAAVPQVSRYNQQINPLIKRKKPAVQKKPVVVQQSPAGNANHKKAVEGGQAAQNIMTTEEVERHLLDRSRQSQSLIELRAPPTVPTEMFEDLM